jgi:uncharacterized protein YndB with AHSA1/START domain
VSLLTVFAISLGYFVTIVDATIESDIRAGGSSFYSMSDGGTTTMYGRAEYLEIERPHRLV